MAFFTATKSLKRKRGPVSGATAQGKGAHKPYKRAGPSKKRREDDEDEDGSRDENAGFGLDDIDLRRPREAPESSGEEDDNETPASKRLRLAKLYLESVKKDIAQADDTYDAAEIDRDLIAARLKQDVLQQSGKLHDYVADSISPDQSLAKFLRVKGHRLPVTCAAASQDDKFLFTSGKEGSIIKWDLTSGKQLACFPKARTEPAPAAAKGKGKARAVDATPSSDIQGHTAEVLTLALSDDGEFLASGGRDKRLGVWDARKGTWIRGFGGHKDAITACVFRKGTTQLFTASLDRTIKLWDLSVLAYVETLFGHQDSITGLDSLRAETAVSSGGRDKTLRFWKVPEESQLVFRGGGKSKVREILEGGMEDEDMEGEGEAERSRKTAGGFIEGSLECVAMVDESTFLSGGDSGSISLWSTAKKKPLFTCPCAHGVNETLSETEGPIRTPRWITSLACLRYSDLFASGSWDGRIRLWKLEGGLRSFSPVSDVVAAGFVNSLQFISPPLATIAHANWAREPSQTNGHVNGDSKKEQGRGIVLVAGMGQEPRTGRWMRIKGPEAQNCTLVIPLRLTGKIAS